MGAVVLALMSLSLAVVLLPGSGQASQRKGRQVSSVTPHAGLGVSDTVVITGSAITEPLPSVAAPSNPSPETARGPAVQRPRPPTPVVDLSRQASRTQASWYARFPPTTCWDAKGGHEVPRTEIFIAMRDQPCGTLVTISGPAGSITAPVEDHGPWGNEARSIDASTAVFTATVGPLGQGVGEVSYVLAG